MSSPLRNRGSLHWFTYLYSVWQLSAVYQQRVNEIKSGSICSAVQWAVQKQQHGLLVLSPRTCLIWVPYDFFNWGDQDLGGGSILHWQASNLVKCVVSTAAPVRAIANLKREGETKKDCAFKWSFNAWHNSGSLMPAIYSIMYIYIQGRGGITILKFPHPHLLAQPWQGQSRKQAKMAQAYSSKSQHE